MSLDEIEMIALEAEGEDIEFGETESSIYCDNSNIEKTESMPIGSKQTPKENTKTGSMKFTTAKPISLKKPVVFSNVESNKPG